jgi:hypothetical protein
MLYGCGDEKADPRRHCRGLIEARLPDRSGSTAGSSSAASLKLDRGKDFQALLDIFRGVTAAASLKWQHEA